MLNSFFAKCFNSRSAPLEENATRGVTTRLEEFPDDLYCTEEEVRDLLSHLDISKSNGPDGISAKMLKYTAPYISSSITQLFNLSIRTGKIPNAWKESHVVPIPKSSTVHDPKNYRPISLLSILSKVLEKHICSLILCHMEEFHPLSKSQWGFRAGRSTVTALLLTVHRWLQLMESGKEICAVFLDYKKAFDSVPHKLLIEKLQQIGLHNNLLAWITDYLTQRKQRVVVEGATSSQALVSSGVPQGSVLGPLLFSIYIDDITGIALSPQSDLVLYADDVLLYRTISCREDISLLQSDLDAIETWSTDHLLQLNPVKCKRMLISKKRHLSIGHFTLFLDGNELEEVSIFKYLGVLIKSNLSWSEHTMEICSKARKILGLLYRHFYNNSSSETLRQLYLSLVRPHLEYAVQLWDPYMQNDIDKLESVQKFALKLVTHQWDANYNSMLEVTDIPRLSERRLHLKLAQVYKIIHNLCYFPEAIFQRQAAHSERLARTDTLRCPFARTNYFYNSFVPSSIAAWNSLDDSQVCTTTLSSFKRLLYT